MKSFIVDMEVVPMSILKEVNLMEEIRDEVDSYSDDSLYNITSFGTDLSFREIVTMYKEGDLEKPELQRKYVWTKNEASRFVDSILLGLPVPSIFLAKNKEGKRLIVDGYQRIMTIYDYMEGIFSGDNKVFKLSNTENINQRWRGKAYSELTDEQRRIIRTSPIHAIIFEQKQPQNDTGMYQIFERINTSGRVLKPQEIRNCVYHGKFNKFLMELNKLPIWRKILKSDVEDSRMADIELILRFFAFSELRTRKEMDSNEEASASAESIPTPKEQETPGKSKPSQPYAALDDIWTGLQDSYRDMAENVQKEYGVTIKKLGAIGFSALQRM